MKTHHLAVKTLLLSTVLLFSGCQAVSNTKPTSSQATTKIPPPYPQQTPVPLKHAYDFHIIDTQTQQQQNVQQLAESLKEFDVVFIGEAHNNHASHLLEMELVSALYQLRPEQILSLEMFNRNQQPILDRYLDGEVGEIYLIYKSPAWDNYIASYRPLVEHAKQRLVPVIASNAAADIVRCIGREGKSYLTKLSEQETTYIAKRPFIDNEAYRLQYMDFLKKARDLSDERKENSYLAQLSRDNTMAESIFQAWSDNPDAQIIHLNGSFHSDFHLGTVAALKERVPNLNIAVISPVVVDNMNRPSYTDEDLTRGQYIYLIPQQPEQYTDRAARQKHHKAMFTKAREKQCRPDPDPS